MKGLTFTILALLQAPLSPSPLWTIAIPGRILAVAPATNGQCVAVVTDASVVMVDAAGRIAWQTPLIDAADTNRQTPQAAASPACDWAAVVTRSGRVQLIEQRGTIVMAGFGDPTKAIDSSTFFPRSMQMAPDGSALAIGTERDWLVLVSRAGVVKTIPAGELGMPITAVYAADGKHIVVTGLWTAGVITTEGTWVWRRQVDFSHIDAASDLSRFAGYFTPTHGPAGGVVAIIDAQGKTTWSLNAWEPGAKISPDGSFVAYVTIPGRDMPPPDAPTVLFISDPAGRTLAQLQIVGYLESITADGCVLVHERSAADVPYDLVARNRTLKEVWRLPAQALPYNQTRLSARLLFVYRGSSLVAFRLPGCR